MRLVSLSVFLSAFSLLAFGSNVPRQSNSSDLTGGFVCVSRMCITATVNSTDVEYVLQSSSANVGWMAIGFGQKMGESPMVIMWPNSDGTVTLSQRTSNDHDMPTVENSPPRVASLQPSSTDLNRTTPKMAFTVPKNSDTIQNIIWAFGITNPESSAVDAQLVQHLDAGATKLDLTGSFSSDSPTLGNGNPFPALPPYQRLIIAHGVLCIVGFLFLLPLGALVGRYLRTITTMWFKGHWFIQVFLAGPIIVSGFALGVASVSEAGGMHFGDDHMICGIVIAALYLFQCTFGFVIHKFKPKSSINLKGRPYQNYLHAVLGLSIIGLALYQVRTGYKSEWPLQTGKMPLPKAADVVWILWVVLLPLLYFVGLAFLPRQWRQEKEKLSNNELTIFHGPSNHDSRSIPYSPL